MKKEKLATYSGGLVILIIVLLLLTWLIVSQSAWLAQIIALSGTEGGSVYYISCEDGDVIQEINQEWVRSNNITSYEDIPKNQTKNIPQRIKESLKADPSFWLTATKYKNLSESKKEVFKKGLNGTRINKSESLGTLVLYQEDVYYCDIGEVRQGA